MIFPPEVLILLMMAAEVRIQGIAGLDDRDSMAVAKEF
jgi:hypothetical protein